MAKPTTMSAVQMEAILGGTVFQHSLSDWLVTWESSGNYRYWCVQAKCGHTNSITIVLKNPGRLSGDGSDLNRDTTLRILREVGSRARVNWLVLNLFDYADPKPAGLHQNWELRDAEQLVYPAIAHREHRYLMLAHGDFDRERYADYAERANVIRAFFPSSTAIPVPLTKRGNPHHPMNWQRMKLTDEIIASIVAHL